MGGEISGRMVGNCRRKYGSWEHDLGVNLLLIAC